MTLLKKGLGGGDAPFTACVTHHCLSLPKISWVTLDAGPTFLHFSKAWWQFFLDPAGLASTGLVPDDSPFVGEYLLPGPSPVAQR